ncbi:hypothetical protein [Brevibacillus dissolubilis]|uniref:hypothetical protein n=1 Tax=Brevibacillus dissolubilis TaxID=1844116 RepID=UPI00159BCB49|nr:hypothetical protein [Brevibacillus dissolubilis]
MSKFKSLGKVSVTHQDITKKQSEQLQKASQGLSSIEKKAGFFGAIGGFRRSIG